MTSAALVTIIFSDVIIAAIAILFVQRFRGGVVKTQVETDKRERELKRKVLELQILRSLSERAGYSLDLQQILEVITDSLSGLLDFSTVSYMTVDQAGRIILKNRVKQPIPRLFLDQVRAQMLNAFSAMVKQPLQANYVEETTIGENLSEEASPLIGSFFNLPLTIGGKVVALINVSSGERGLYGDEETAILYTILEQVSTSASKLAQVVENEKRRLSAMVGSLADGIMMVSPNLEIIVTNPAMMALIDFQNYLQQAQLVPDSFSQVSFLDVVAAIGTKSNLKSAVATALEQKNIVKLPEFDLNNKAIQIDVEPVIDRYGYLLGVVVVFHDVTSHKQLEKLRNDFTAMMVHELRTPLTVISYAVDTMASDLDSLSTEEIGKNLSTIKDSAGHMLSLVNQLLDEAKIESGKFEVVKKEDDLAHLLEEEVEALKTLADQKQLHLILNLDPQVTMAIFDRTRLKQAIDNLISNAIKYTDQGEVTVSAKLSGEEVVVSVADTGDGIKAEDLPKLFSKFEQLGKGKTGEKVGTGLGLVITKGIIEAHGGKIWASSPGPGKGSTFSFTLPLNNSSKSDG